MLGRRRSGVGRAPTRRQALVLGLAAATVAGGLTAAALTVRPNTARSFDLYYGTLLLDDDTAPVAVDLASGKPTVRLTQAYTQVGAERSGDLDLTPLAHATLMLDTATGEFNMVDGAGFVIKTDGGVSLPGEPPATSTASGVGAGDAAGDAAYILRTGASGTDVYLVGPATVAAASAPGARAAARGYARLAEPVADGPGSRVGANGDLWLLTGGAGTHSVLRLRLPDGSEPGAALQRADLGRVNGPAALAAAPERADGSGPSVVGVATASSLRVFAPDGTSRERVVQAPGDVDEIVPAGGAHGRLAFLLHSPSGWSLLSAELSGTGPVRAVPLAGGGMLPDAPLAVPAASGGALYTLQKDTGALWRIQLAGGEKGTEGTVEPVRGMPAYPVLTGERADFDRATVTARGSRVVFNARANLQAVTVFTDGSRPPVLIDKRTAVDLDASGAATLLDRPEPAKPQPGPQKPEPQQQPPVSDRIDCATTTQVPHIPAVQLIDRASRSVRLQWSYPLLDRQDCAPSTYTVAAQLVRGGAPRPPAPVRVQGQTGLNLTGLFPDTEYRIVVTAYLNGKGTPSEPLLVRTGPEGPAAPTNVRAAVDDAGNWLLSWDSCGGAQDGCVPSAGWTVIPRICDGAGLSAPPPSASVIGDPAQRQFGYAYRGGSALLGRGLSFQVEGVGERGEIGTASAATGCSYSWSRPRSDLVQVTASAPAPTSGRSTTTTATVSFTGDRVLALGGHGGQLVYRLVTGPGDTVVSSVGPTESTTVRVPGVQPGQRYRLSVQLVPPHHPEGAVTLPAVDVVPAVADWPALTLSASFHNTSSSTGELRLRFHGLTSAAAQGETFDLTDSSLRCGNTQLQLSRSSFDPAQPLRFGGVERAVYNGSCTLTAQLVQNAQTATDPPVFGAPPSPPASTEVTLDPPSANVTQSDFDAAWSGEAGSPAVTIDYDNADPLLVTYATNWSLTVTNDGGATRCASASKPPPAQLAVDRGCIKTGGDFLAVVAFRYFDKAYSFAVEVSGVAPAPLKLTADDFATHWEPKLAADGNARLTLTYTGTADLAAGGTDWREVVRNPSQRSCGALQTVPTADGLTLVVDRACLSKTPSSGWTVRVGYTDVNTAEAKVIVVPVSGLPPAHP